MNDRKNNTVVHSFYRTVLVTRPAETSAERKFIFSHENERNRLARARARARTRYSQITRFEGLRRLCKHFRRRSLIPRALLDLRYLQG